MRSTLSMRNISEVSPWQTGADYLALIDRRLGQDPANAACRARLQRYVQGSVVRPGLAALARASTQLAASQPSNRSSAAAQLAWAATGDLPAVGAWRGGDTAGRAGDMHACTHTLRTGPFAPLQCDGALLEPHAEGAMLAVRSRCQYTSAWVAGRWLALSSQCYKFLCSRATSSSAIAKCWPAGHGWQCQCEHVLLMRSPYQPGRQIVVTPAHGQMVCCAGVLSKNYTQPTTTAAIRIVRTTVVGLAKELNDSSIAAEATRLAALAVAPRSSAQVTRLADGQSNWLTDPQSAGLAADANAIIFTLAASLQTGLPETMQMSQDDACRNASRGLFQHPPTDAVLPLPIYMYPIYCVSVQCADRK